MGRLVKLIGSGIGLASEAYQTRKESKAARSLQTSPAVAGPSNAPVLNPVDSAPAQYAEVSDEQADRLFAQGQAVPVDEKERAFAKGASPSEKDEFGYDLEDESDYSLEDDEQDWALDEAADPPAYSEVVQDEAPRTVNNANFSPPQAPTGVKLPYPVILPQRRPGSKNRGFVRAYAPDLAACGIDQATFLRFLKTFQQEAQASPAFTALIVAAGIAGLAPSLIAMAVTTAVAVAAKTGKEVQSRYRANAFLDKMNRELFMPLGLYAMMIKYKPETSSTSPFASTKHTTVDITTELTKFTSIDDLSAIKSNMRNLRLAAGTTRGEANMPTLCAPLIFPGVDAATTTLAEPRSAADEAQQGKWKASQKFVAEYMDRRAQATYLAENPDTTLSAQISPDQQPRFRSRFSDPNHPASSGDPLALLSGGLISGGRRPGGPMLGGLLSERGVMPWREEKLARREDKRAYKDERREDKRAHKDERREEKQVHKDERREEKQIHKDEKREDKRAYKDVKREDKRAYKEERRFAGRRGMRGSRLRNEAGLVGVVRKVLKEDVLYLTIVNMPSPSEMEEARRALAQQQ